MAHYLHNIYIFENNHENLPNYTSHSTNYSNSMLHHDNLQTFQNIIHWRPSTKLQRLYVKFQNNILKQWQRIACVYCGKLLYPEKALWTFYDPTFTYPLQRNIPNISLSFNPNTNCIPYFRIPTCESCKKPSTRFLFPHLSPMPNEIISVPLHLRMYLSPVYLHCSLGRTPNSNPYSEYRV